MVEITCPCGTKKEVKKGQLYCSRKCARKYAKRKVTQKDKKDNNKKVTKEDKKDEVKKK